MPAETTRRYRGATASERQSTRRTSLVQAALDLVGESGAGAVTVESVCGRAGLTKRYFYESFADRDALFVALIESLMTDVRSAIAEALGADADGALATRVRVTVEALVVTLDADPRRARLYAEAAAHPSLHARREAALGEFAELIVVEVLRVDPADPRHRLDARLIVAGTTDVVSHWLAGDLGLTRAQLVDEVTRIGLAVAGS